MVPDDAGDAVLNRPHHKAIRPGQAETGTVFFLGDPLDSLDTEWDSSLHLKAAHERRAPPPGRPTRTS